MEGKGIMNWPDGRTYEGEWSLDHMHNFGKMTFPDGRKYVGGWRNGQRHGEATITLKNGETKAGIFDNGKVASWMEAKEKNLLECNIKERANLNSTQMVSI